MRLDYVNQGKITHSFYLDWIKRGKEREQPLNFETLRDLSKYVFSEDEIQLS